MDTKQQNSTPVKPARKIVDKVVRHDFSPDELNTMGADLARSFSGLRGIESEFDQVKATYEARTAEAEATIDRLSTARINGFEMRSKRCAIVYEAKERKKYFVPEERIDAGGSFIHEDIAAIEDMTPDDFAMELIQAESEFEKREEIQLFPQSGNDRGVLVTGSLAGKWFTALRIQVGQRRIEERLDSEQRSCKQRADALSRGAKRAQEWLVENLGKEAAEGFKAQLAAMVEAQKERVE